MKRRKILVVILLIFVVVLILQFTGVWSRLCGFMNVYISYINADIARQADLLESILGGVCTGMVTFGALFITILHENKKDKIAWERERQKDKEERLLSVRPFLNIKVDSVSGIRSDNYTEVKDYVTVGKGNHYLYAHIQLTNQGYGVGRKISIDGHECSIQQLGKDQEGKMKLYFKGIEDDAEDIDFQLVLICEDIFGNKYSQIFKCQLMCKSRELNVEIFEGI